MDTVKLLRSPHFSWIGFGLQVPPDGMPLRVHWRARSFGISVVLKGRRFARWIRRGNEVRWTAGTGAVHFLPADGECQTCLMNSDAGCELHSFWIPGDQLRSWTAAEGVDAPVEWHRIAADDDVVLRSCLTRLARVSAAGWGTQGIEEEEVARRLVLRLAELHGAHAPDWRVDRSVFDGRALGDFAAYVDEHLCCAPSLGDMAALAGLSPSHFARKFRHSTGLSFHRFVNVRRLQAALNLLKDDSTPLAHVALDLGWSSQSHFTRIFSDVTGMTPARYRRLYRQPVH